MDVGKNIQLKTKHSLKILRPARIHPLKMPLVFRMSGRAPQDAIPRRIVAGKRHALGRCILKQLFYNKLQPQQIA